MTTPSPALNKLIPGFEFLQDLVKNAGAAMPGMNQWIAPTLDPEVLGKRIEELRTVQFWLEQNARMLAASIQALEVQRMTLSTLKTMNVTVGELGNAMKLRTPEPASAAKATPAAAPAAAGAKEAPSAIADPMQWWSALTQQFTQLAVQAMKDGGSSAQSLAGAMAKVPTGVAAAAAATAQTPAEPARAAAPARSSAASPAASPAPSRTAAAAAPAPRAAAKRRRPARKAR